MAIDYECLRARRNIAEIFEYDAQIALKAGKVEENVLTVSFPHSAVIALRYTGKTPNFMRIRLVANKL